MAATMGGPEDKVVREMDIYFCTSQLQGTKVRRGGGKQRRTACVGAS